MRQNTSNLWSYIKRHWKLLCLWIVVTFSPVILGVIFIYVYGSIDRTVLWFSAIPGNDYSINSVLLIFILTSYGFLFFNFVVYFGRTFFEKYRGTSRSYKAYSLLSIILDILILLAIILYILFIVGCHWMIQVSWFTFQYIIKTNTILTGLIFVLFVAIDFFTINCERIKLRELEAQKDHAGGGEKPIVNDIPDEENRRIEEKNAGKEKQRIENNIWFCRFSTYVISFPVIILLFWAYVVARGLVGAEGFRDYFIDKSFYHMLRVPVLGETTYNLFIMGMETGVVVSVLLFSQIVFLFLKFWWHYRNYLIEKT